MVIAALASAGCERGPTGPTFVPGPGVSAVPTAEPLTWNSREELTAWVVNPVSKGPISVEEEGSDAFIRVITGNDVTILRGPDLNPPTKLAGVRLRYRWVQTAPPGSSGISMGGSRGDAARHCSVDAGSFARPAARLRPLRVARGLLHPFRAHFGRDCLRLPPALRPEQVLRPARFGLDQN
jgi:hypothetical protein